MILDWLKMHGHFSFWIATAALGISMANFLVAFRDRRRTLSLHLLGGKYFFVVDLRLIRAKLAVFNPSSRANCIQKWTFVVQDGEGRSFTLGSEPSVANDGDGQMVSVNNVPCSISPGSGVAVDLYALDYKATHLGKNCTFIVEAEDIYGRRYVERETYTNRWPREHYPHDL